MKKVWIYALTDHEGIVRYVGQTNCVERRYVEHVEEADETAKSLKCRWIAEHLEEHGMPGVKILTMCHPSESNATEAKHQFMHKSTVMQGKIRDVVHEDRYINRVSRRRPESPGASTYRQIQNKTIRRHLWNCQYDVSVEDVRAVFRPLRAALPSSATKDPKTGKAKKPIRRHAEGLTRPAEIDELAQKYYDLGHTQPLLQNQGEEGE